MCSVKIGHTGAGTVSSRSFKSLKKEQHSDGQDIYRRRPIFPAPAAKKAVFLYKRGKLLYNILADEICGMENKSWL
ncbi:hypothetical protein OBV_03070 [Oscillibacter valericigenes Sjm18-20]|nr:hypothetical protein OBV_03070 [Oscillibacter valericigenes Sjm18-20]